MLIYDQGKITDTGIEVSGAVIIIGDVDGDSINEIVYTTSGGNTSIYDQGNITDTGIKVRYGTKGDINDDCIDEIIYSASEDYILIYDQGNITDTGIKGLSKTTGDVDGDGVDEIIFLYQSKIVVYDTSLFYFYFTTDTTPPEIKDTNVNPRTAITGTISTITSSVYDAYGVASVTAHIQNPDENDIVLLTLYDDGLHSDKAANDNIYGNAWDSTGYGEATYYIDIIAVDISDNSGEVDNAANFSIDQSPPTIQNTFVDPNPGNIGTLLAITSRVYDISGVTSVISHVQNPDETDIVELTLYDDGLHNDGLANDGIYGNIWDSIDNSIGTYYVDIFVNDSLGNSGEVDNTATYSLIVTNIINAKDITKYSNKHVFLISDEDWHDVLSVVPLTIWMNGSSIIKNPILVYHLEGSSFDPDSIIHFMQLYKPENVTIIGNSPADFDNLLVSSPPTGVGLSSEQINRIFPSNYFSYWDTINSTVVVDFDNYKSGLLASAFASYNNAPILFLNSNNLDTYKNLIDGRLVYTVGSLDSNVIDYINNNASSVISYSFEDLQRQYINMTRTNKVILTNLNDLNIYLSTLFSPEKSGSSISRLFSEHSLTAPILASAKRELIIFTDVPGSPENTGCDSVPQITNNVQLTDDYVMNNVTTLFKNIPEYLTVIASPKAIPDSLYWGCHYQGIWQYRDAVDWKYGSFDDSTYHMKVGRIYGLTISDASSYIAKSVFYDRLFYEKYGINNYTGLSIGHSYTAHIDSARMIKNATSNSGYDSVCFTSVVEEVCIQNISPSTSFYKGRQFITFGNHGGPDEWYNTIHSSSLPWMDLPYSFAGACLTNNYWQGSIATFGPYFLRRGGIGYHGSTSVTYSGSNELTAIQNLTGENRISLGELHNNIRYARDHFIILGDPTLKPIFKKVIW